VKKKVKKYGEEYKLGMQKAQKKSFSFFGE
jgi:hypothetical protein